MSHTPRLGNKSHAPHESYTVVIPPSHIMLAKWVLFYLITLPEGWGIVSKAAI